MTAAKGVPLESMSMETESSQISSVKMRLTLEQVSLSHWPVLLGEKTAETQRRVGGQYDKQRQKQRLW